MRLPECRAVLTGASGGIGLALAEKLCAGGAQLIAVTRQEGALSELRHSGGTPMPLPPPPPPVQPAPAPIVKPAPAPVAEALLVVPAVVVAEASPQ